MKPAVYACGDQVSVPVPLPVGPRGDYGDDVAWLAGEVIGYRINGGGQQILTVKLASGRVVSVAAPLCRGARVSGATP
jgi:hypothetical protein